MYEAAKENILSKKPRMAICYDFDKTLSPDDMQSFTLIPSLGMKKEEFWPESNKLAEDNLMDNNLAWMYQLIIKSTACRKSISREYFKDIGKDVPLYDGVETWFDRVNKYGEQKGIEVQHYIISSGLKEIIEGSSIAHHIKRIYASSYLYSADGVAEWPAQAVNYTNKTQFIFRIAKGKFEEYDESVNDSMQESQLYIPYENIVYIGDSATDIPCMRLVKSKGGYSIGVFDPVKNKRKKIYQLFNDDRINLYAPADYSEGSTLFRNIQSIIDVIISKEKLKAEHDILNLSASAYKIHTFIEVLTNLTPDLPSKDKEILDNSEKEIRNYIEGNID